MRRAGKKRRFIAAALAGGLGLAACGGSTPPEVGLATEGSSGSGTMGVTTAVVTGSSTSSTPADGTSTSPGSGSGSGSGSGGSTGPLDSSGTSSGTTAALEDSGSSSDSTTGEVSTVGCADGFREALIDEVAYPNVAACAGGFWVPGVGSPVSQCEREGGDDGPWPDGMGCSIEDLCAEGWHLCASRQEVMVAGLAGGCGGVAWGSQFFATGQSGEGANTCNDTGTNDVFGCGDLGYSDISGCAPLNRSTGNLCVELPGVWSCSDDAYDEVTHLVKPGPSDGGALCCRDGV